MVSLSRRGILAAGVGGAALVATGGIWRVSRVPTSAFAPWDLDPTPPDDVRLDAFRHAILAPNPHNRQPWLIELVGEDEAILTCDQDRLLPDTDPFDRQTTIGFGTFIETARIACTARGVRMDVTPLPDGARADAIGTAPVAHLKFVADAAIARDPLFDHITTRRSNKEEYDLSRTIAQAHLEAVTADGGAFTNDPEQTAQLTEQIVAAIETEMLTPAANMESVELMRIGYSEVDANPDGIELHGPMIEAGKLVGMIDREALADPESSAFQQGLDMMRTTYGSVPALVWITTNGNSRKDQLEAGRQYVRANLHATALGLAMHPMSQSLQEYTEVQPMFERVHQVAGAKPGERIQMLARVGYGPRTGPAPRWPLDTHMV
ncbi:MAG: twin-arginine translocation pathway signal protein [Pseudomonadota bacterium]